MIELPDRPDWDALVPVWHLLEDGGLNRDIVLAVGPLVEPPVLCVGGGTGFVPALVRDQLEGAPVVSLDCSEAMTRRARHRTGLACVMGDAVALPFSGGRFGTVLCATGVLEFMTSAGRAAAVAEMARVCRPGGLLLIAAASSDSGVIWDIDQHALVRSWFGRGLADDSPVATTFDAVASAVGGRQEARALLLSSLPRRGRSLTTPIVAAAADAAGLDGPELVIELNGTGVWRIAPAGAFPRPDRRIAAVTPAR